MGAKASGVDKEVSDAACSTEGIERRDCNALAWRKKGYKAGEEMIKFVHAIA